MILFSAWSTRWHWWVTMAWQGKGSTSDRCGGESWNIFNSWNGSDGIESTRKRFLVWTSEIKANKWLVWRWLPGHLRDLNSETWTSIMIMMIVLLVIIAMIFITFLKILFIRVTIIVILRLGLVPGWIEWGCVTEKNGALCMVGDSYLDDWASKLICLLKQVGQGLWFVVKLPS